MDFLEKDLEQIIYENLKTTTGCEALNKLGLDISYTPFVYRQPRIGDYGVADIITFSNEFNRIVIYELKNKKVGLETLLQAGRYMKGIKRYIESKLSYDCNDFEFEIILIGREISTSDWVYLFDGLLDNIKVYTYNYDLFGILFENNYLHNYCLVNEKFDV